MDKREKELNRAERFLGKVFVLGESRYDKNNIAELLVAYRSYDDPEDSEMSVIIDYIAKNRLKTGGNERDFTYRRNYLYKYIREVHGLTYRAIGELFGGKNHATVMHGINLHDTLVDIKDPVYASTINKMKERFKL